MHKLYTFFLILTVFSATAQMQLPNKDFEFWDNIVYKSTTYFEALGWSSEICDTTENLTVCETAAKRSDDAFNGFYALEVTTQAAATVALSNVTISERPDSFNVRIKPTMASTDTFEINILLHQNPVGSEDIGLIGEAVLKISDNTNSYLKYEAAIDYTSEEIPRYISVFMFMLNEPGNTPVVLADAFNLLYTEPTSVFDAFSERILFGPNPVKNTILTHKDVIRYEILSLSGSRIETGTANQIETSNLQEGLYAIRLFLVNGDVVTSKFVKA